MKTFDEVALTHFHGFTPEQWINLKNRFPYCEIENIAKSYASQFIDEAAKVATIGEGEYIDSITGERDTSQEVNKDSILNLKSQLH